MTPSVGRIVLFHGKGDPVPAIVTRVWSGDCVNLHVFQDALPSVPVTSVVFRDSNPGAGQSWSWPPRT